MSKRETYKKLKKSYAEEKALRGLSGKLEEISKKLEEARKNL